MSQAQSPAQTGTQSVEPTTDQQAQLDEILERVDRLERENEQLEERVDDLEDEVDALRERVDADGDDSGGSDEPETPLENVHVHDYRRAGVTESPSIDRALTIYENFPRWAKHTKKGWVLNIGKEGLLRELRLARQDDDDLKSWVQVYRACEVLHEMTGAKIAFDDENKRLRMANPSLCKYNPERVEYDLQLLLAGKA